MMLNHAAGFMLQTKYVQEVNCSDASTSKKNGFKRQKGHLMECQETIISLVECKFEYSKQWMLYVAFLYGRMSMISISI